MKRESLVLTLTNHKEHTLRLTLSRSGCLKFDTLENQFNPNQRNPGDVFTYRLFEMKI